MSQPQLTVQIGKTLANKGNFNISANYLINDIVFYNGSSYICVAENVTGLLPTETQMWQLFVSMGMSGLIPLIEMPFASNVILTANFMTVIDILTGSIIITLDNDPIPNFVNEWGFTITQGSTAQDIALPIIKWGDTMPTFAANSTTEVRLSYLGAQLCGEWRTA